MNEPQRMAEVSVEVKRSRKIDRKIQLEPWDITIIGEQSMGTKAEMEDEVWFQPSFTIDNKTYL